MEATPAYDVTPGVSFHPKGEANGYIVTIGGKRIYIVGVTECVPEIRAAKDIDVAFFPMNLPAARMEPAAAIECIKAFKPKVVYPYHYDQDWVTRVNRGEPRGSGDDARTAGDERRAGSRRHRSAPGGLVSEIGAGPAGSSKDRPLRPNSFQLPVSSHPLRRCSG